MKFRTTALLTVAASLLTAVPTWSAPIAGLDVYVGYADDLRPSPFFPNPFDGTNGTSAANIYIGSPCGDICGRDAGAIRLTNTTGSDILISDVNVTFFNSATFDLWGSFNLPAGQTAVLTQTSFYNFDTSDVAIFESCGTYAPAGTNDPTVTINTTATYDDSGHILDTGGFDSVCLVDGNNNESLQWRLIGTTGANNPGGTVPEPVTLSIFGAGLAGAVAMRRRRKKTV